MASSSAERVRRYRARKRLEKQLQAQAPTPPPKEAVERIFAANAAIESATGMTLYEAADAGYAFRIFEEVRAGNRGAEPVLRDWIEGEPKGLWLLLDLVARKGLWGEWEAWREGRLQAGSAPASSSESSPAPDGASDDELSGSL